MVFRPKIYFRPTIHVITFTFFNVFLRFFENPKNVTFYVFFGLLHTFSLTMPSNTEYKHQRLITTSQEKQFDSESVVEESRR